MQAVHVPEEDLERLVECACRAPADPVVQLVLREDQPDNALARRDPLDGPLVEHVALLPEPISGVGRDNRQRALRVGLVEQVERLVEGALAHVRHVDEHALPRHRAYGCAPELGETLGRLRKQPAVEPVGHERQRGGVCCDATPDKVRQRDVGDAPARQHGDRAVDRFRLSPQVEAALDAVDEGDLAALDGGAQRCHVADDDRVLSVMLGDVLIDQLELAHEPRQVAGLGRRGVRGIEGELVEERIEHREDEPDAALLKRGHRHARPAVEGPVVAEAPREPDEPGPQPVAQAVAPAGRGEQLERALPHSRHEMHRVVGVEVADHESLARARSLR
jgi:hypothetical protein